MYDQEQRLSSTVFWCTPSTRGSWLRKRTHQVLPQTSANPMSQVYGIWLGCCGLSLPLYLRRFGKLRSFSLRRLKEHCSTSLSSWLSPNVRNELALINWLTFSNLVYINSLFASCVFGCLVFLLRPRLIANFSLNGRSFLRKSSANTTTLETRSMAFEINRSSRAADLETGEGTFSLEFNSVVSHGWISVGLCRLLFRSSKRP